MSRKNKNEKIKIITSSKKKEENDSQSQTYLDSLYNSKICNREKENINKNNQLNIHKENKYISKQKQKNFYMALKTINTDNENIKNLSSSLNSSKISNNLLSLISEFSEINIDKSKDFNISKYLHRPITKQIIKLGNQIIKKTSDKEYKVNNGLEINKPLISTYNMQNIFEKFNNTFIEIENSNTNSKIFEKEVKNETCKIGKNENNKSRRRNKKLKHFHQKNKSSITNYYFNENNSERTTINYNRNRNKNNRYIIHYKDNISSLIGGQNRINYKDKESNTTVTKDDCIKDFMQIHEVNDINININIFNNNRNLEVINDFDETKENKMLSTNKKNELNKTSNNSEIFIKNDYFNQIPKNIFNDDKKGKTSTESKENNIYLNNINTRYNAIDLSEEENNNKIKTFNKFNNYSMNKTLRKKYERTEFKFKYVENNFYNYNINEQNNNYIMKNLINKFDQCSDITNIKPIEKKEELEKMESSFTNKNNDTFIIKGIDNDLLLNIDDSVNDSFINYNFPNYEQSSLKQKSLFNDISIFSIRNELINIKSNIYNNINKSNDNINIDRISNNFSLNIDTNNNLNLKKRNTFPLILKDNKKYNYSSPEQDKSGIKIHPFNLDSSIHKNDLIIIKSNLNLSSSHNDNNYEIKNSQSIHSNEISNDPQPQSVYDYTFYQKLLKAEEDMSKKCKILLNYESILNTEIRLEILLWMMKTCEEFAFKRDTYHNSCYYFDMYLITNGQPINDKSELELIGITCIAISAKLEEIQLPRLKEYAELLSDKYNIKSIIEMEKKICSKLGWRLIVMTKNIWLSWYLCQWDLFIDTIDNIKQDLLNIIDEKDILYYKKPNDNSYYNYRKITQLIDIMTMDFYFYNFEPRVLIAASFFILICYNYQLRYNFIRKKFENNTPLSNLLLDIYDKFLTQSFDYNFNDKQIQNAIKYCYNYISFPFIFDLPLLYQIHQSKLDGDSYEDFLSYQTNNDNFYKVIKERIKINKMMKIKKKPIINNNKNNNSHRKTVSSYNNSKINNKK